MKTAIKRRLPTERRPAPTTRPLNQVQLTCSFEINALEGHLGLSPLRGGLASHGRGMKFVVVAYCKGGNPQSSLKAEITELASLQLAVAAPVHT